jgi:hypothetical protein
VTRKWLLLFQPPNEIPGIAVTGNKEFESFVTLPYAGQTRG